MRGIIFFLVLGSSTVFGYSYSCDRASGSELGNPVLQLSLSERSLTVKDDFWMFHGESFGGENGFVRFLGDFYPSRPWMNAEFFVAKAMMEGVGRDTLKVRVTGEDIYSNSYSCTLHR